MPIDRRRRIASLFCVLCYVLCVLCAVCCVLCQGMMKQIVLLLRYSEFLQLLVFSSLFTSSWRSSSADPSCVKIYARAFAFAVERAASKE